LSASLALIRPKFRTSEQRYHVAARCANLAMCKTQQLYPPLGGGEGVRQIILLHALRAKTEFHAAARRKRSAIARHCGASGSASTTIRSAPASSQRCSSA